MERVIMWGVIGQGGIACRGAMPEGIDDLDIESFDN